MIENTAQDQEQAEPELQIEITDDPVEEQAAPVNSDDELDTYTKGVSKRINKLNAQTRAAEQRAEQFERLALQKDQELQQYRQIAQQQQSTVLEKEEEALKSKEAQVDDIYRKAVQAGDPDLMSKADSLKNDIAIQKEKLRVAKTRQAQEQPIQPQAQENYQTYQPEQVAQQDAAPQPTAEAKDWHSKNPWYGDQSDEENLQATQFAYFTHYNLINEGYEPDSEDYYQALDSRVRKVYPNLSVGEEASTETVESNTRQPAVQRVASTTSSGRQQTRGSSDGVKFTKSELEKLRGLKPHNMSEERWLQVVAKEKQKVANRSST
tara:strand:- start:6332 stop:7297 length:966 start_codon:yes stop_codon:yes gene_type:complete